MIQIVEGPQVARWAAAHLPEEEDLDEGRGFGECRAFGILKDKKPIAACVFNWFREMRYGNDMRVTIVAIDPSWCKQGVLEYLFSYPFKTAGCVRLTAVIKEGNKRSVRLCEGLGFRKSGVLPRGYNGKANALMYSMLKEQCRWING